MSEAAPDLGDYGARLNIREQIARIDRAIEENAKARVEAAKLAVEREKLAAETTKLTAEALKLARDRAVAPWQVIVAAVAAGAASVEATVALLGALDLLRVAGAS